MDKGFVRIAPGTYQVLTHVPVSVEHLPENY